MSIRKFDNSSDESDICYRSKRARPLSDISSEEEFGIGNAYTQLSNLHLSTDITLQEGEWKPVQSREAEVIEHECGQDANLLIQNINCDDPMEIYKLFLTDSIIQRIVQQTNEYAKQSGAGEKRNKHQSSWVDVTIREMENFIGILLIMGIIQMPELDCIGPRIICTAMPL